MTTPREMLPPRVTRTQDPLAWFVYAIVKTYPRFAENIATEEFREKLVVEMKHHPRREELIGQFDKRVGFTREEVEEDPAPRRTRASRK